MPINKEEIPVKDRQLNADVVTRTSLYDELSVVLKDYENCYEGKDNEKRINIKPEYLYAMLDKIRNHWTTIIFFNEPAGMSDIDKRFEKTNKDLFHELEKAYKFIMLSQGINPEEIVDIEIPANYKILLTNKAGSKIMIDIMSNR